MLKIAIVDDENHICSQVERYLLELSKKHLVEVDIDVFFDGSEICEEIKETFYDVVFLDIEMQTLSGIYVSQTIRTALHNEATHIVYISGRTEYAPDLFEFDPLLFLQKPLDFEKIEKAFIKLIYKLNLKQEAFLYKKGRTVQKAPLKEILFFSSDERKILLHYGNHIDCFYGSIDNIYEQLKSLGFLMIHKSYLVNTLHVKKYSYETLTMINNEVLPISQSKRKEVRMLQLELDNKD